MIVCPNCSAQIKESCCFCPSCGHAINTENGKIAEEVNKNQQYQSANYQTQNTSQYQNQDQYQYQNKHYSNNMPPAMDPVQAHNADIIRKGRDANILGIIGIICGIFVSSILGVILSCIGISHSNQALRITGDEEFRKNKNICIWGVVVTAISFIIRMISIIMYLALSMAIIYRY